MHWILKLILHLFFWCTYCLFAGLISFRLNEGLDFILAHYWIFIVNAVWAASAFYIHYLYLFRIVFLRKYYKYLGISLVVSFSVSLLFFAAYRLIWLPYDSVISMMMFVPSFTGTFIIANCGSLLKGFIEWFSENDRKEKLEKQNLKVELEMLRSQLNHHFLFNTLNNIDTLIFKDPQKASDALIALSSILRYMLYETKTDKVSLENEIKNIEHIISLEQLRFSKKEYTSMKVSGNISGIMVPPLLFVSFVENAYKHSKSSDKFPVIDIQIIVGKGMLSFKCSNFFDPEFTGKNNSESVGLKNIRRRLDLIYPGLYRLDNVQFEDTYKVFLEIPAEWKR